MNASPQISSSPVEQQPRSSSKLFAVLALVSIILVNLFTFRHSFAGYFLADDFVHVDYLYHAIDQNFMPLWANFWGNWMQAQGTTFYRPLISITLALDYLAGGANPLTFHISNWLYQTSAACLMFLLVRRIGEIFHPGETGLNRLLGLTSAIIFSVYPLHCEVVNWVIARVDSVALVFCLASFWLYLKGTSLSRKLSLLAFVAGLMSKEMAVTLPPTLFLLVLLSTSEKNKFKAAIKSTWHYWLILVVYLLFRVAVLGTISGGYEGSVGQGLSNSLAKRWLDGSLLRILFPFNIDVFGSKHSLSVQLKIIYGGMLVNFVAAMFSGAKSRAAMRGFIFAMGWLVLSLLPTYQVWNLTAALQGSRFIYFGTAPIALIFAWLIFPRETKNWPVLSALRLAGAIWFSAVLLMITTGNNEPWNHAMREVSLFRQAVVAQVEALPPRQRLCLINVPHTYRGAHMLYNAATMSVLLSQPLTPEAIYQRVLSFEPATFGEPDLINVTRLRNKVDQSKSGIVKFYRWDREQMTLVPVLFTKPQSDNGEISLPALQLNEQNQLLSSQLELNALAPDYVDIDFEPEQIKKLDTAPVVTLTAMNLTSQKCQFNQPVPASGHLRFDVSEHKQWLILGQVNQLALTGQGLGKASLKILGVRSGSLVNQRPLLECDGKTLGEQVDGICRPLGSRPAFNYDATMVPGAVSVYIEVSKPNSWFEHYSGSFRDTKKSTQAQFAHTLGKLKGNGVPLTFSGVKGPGFFQMRAAAIDKDGNIIGYFSDPLNFHI